MGDWIRDFLVGWVALSLLALAGQFTLWLAWHFVLWTPLGWVTDTYWAVARTLVCAAVFYAASFANREARSWD